MAQQFTQIQGDIEAALSQDNALTKIFATLEKQTGVKRLYLFYGLVGIIALWLIFGFGGGFICFVIGFVYPSYQSVKAIESHRREDDTQWLTYWVVFSAFTIVEYASDIFVYWFPLYWFVKCIFLTWCFAPVSWNGSTLIYHRFIRPQYIAHGGKIDDAISRAAASAKELVDQGIKASKVVSDKDE